jgi:intracellular sulfur oxidation DsrE/DsrF family protein
LSIISAGVGLGVVLGADIHGKQPRKHLIVIEVNVEGAENWSGILNNVENVRKTFEGESTDIEIVAHGKGLGLILRTNEALQDRLKKIADAGVRFVACENTMRRMNIKTEDLMPFAETVDSGVAEVVRKQEAGWSYVKGGT